MISFRNRRATILPSTLIVVLTFHAGLLSAQSPEAWPFDEKDQPPANQNSPAPQAKTPVQQKLEELYQRDHRPLPDYMRDNAAPNSGNHTAPRQQPAPLSNRAEQPAPPMPPAPAVTQIQTSSGAQGSIRQQLSDYYSSQGKTMPGTQRSWNSADGPRPTVAVNAQATQGGSSTADAPQPRLIDRINPFRHFWQKDDAAVAPPATAVTSANAASQVATSPNRGTAWGQTATVSVNPPARPPVQPTVVPAPARPVPRYMTVELGPSAPIRLIPAPASPAAQTASASQPPSVASHSVQATTPTVTATTAVHPLPAPAVATHTPSDTPHAAAPHSGSPKIASAHGDGSPSNSNSGSQADKTSAPYTGLTLQDEQDGVTAPDPTAVTTANSNEPADRPPVAPMPAVDLEQPKKTVGQPTKPAPQPSVVEQATPAPSIAPAQPEPTQVTQQPPLKPQTPSESGAPKAFNERQPSAQPIHGPEETAAKMHKIGERVAQKGLKGFCPVVLREQRELVDAVPVYSSVYEAKRYYFSSAEAQARFDREPQKYAPVAGGTDVVVKATSDQSVEGTLDFAVWYKDRLFLFTSPESLEAFSLNPVPYAGPYLKTH
jgi:YHS domain-containing protein